MTELGAERAHVVTPDPAAVEVVLRDLPPAGRTVRGFAADADLGVDSWDVSGHDVRCAGVVRGEEDARAALLCAARGAWVVAAVPDEELLATLFQDLRRLGPVRHWTAGPAAALTAGGSGPPLEADQVALLRLLAAGASVTQAADRLFLSQRTAERRLAAARRLLAVATTAEAVVAFSASESAGPGQHH